MKVFIQVEVEIGIECRLSGLLALAVLIFATVVPHGIAPVKVIADVVRDVGNNKLRPWNCIFFVILHAVSVNFTF